LGSECMAGPGAQPSPAFQIICLLLKDEGSPASATVECIDERCNAGVAAPTANALVDQTRSMVYRCCQHAALVDYRFGNPCAAAQSVAIS
jgi:hypothetical protein